MTLRTRAGRAAAPLLVAALGLALFAGGAAVAGRPTDEEEQEPPPREELATEGAFLFQTYCTSCHGIAAEGDGPVADELRTPPADLTRLSQRNGGTFPSEEVYGKIDGRNQVTAHGPSEMPVWGYAFQDTGSDANQEVEVRRRIMQLVFYLESIQLSEDP